LSRVTRTWVGILIGLGFVAVVVIAAMGQFRVRCEVCMAYRGQQLCEQAAAADRDNAELQARSSACAQISGGVTDGIQCNNTAPLSVTCNE
jgi:hypothetical protein